MSRIGRSFMEWGRAWLFGGSCLFVVTVIAGMVQTSGADGMLYFFFLAVCAGACLFAAGWTIQKMEDDRIKEVEDGQEAR